MGSYLRGLSVFTLLLLVIGEFRVTCQQLQYLGCFDLAYALRQNLHRYMADADLSVCTTLCTKRGNTQIGVEKSDDFCYCGDDIAEESVRRLDSLCNVPCLRNDNYTCGGDWMMSVYRKTQLSTDNPQLANNIGDGNDSPGFLLGMSNGIRFYKESKMSEFETPMETLGWVYSVDYHYSKNLVFANLKANLFRTSFDGKVEPSERTPKLIMQKNSTCEGFAVDWVENQVYLADCLHSDVRIMTIDLEGNNKTEVMERVGDTVVIKRMTIDPYVRKLFWTADGVIESYDLLKNNFNTNLSVPGVTVRGLSLDLEEHRVYYVGFLNFSSSLYSMDYEGGESTLHYSTQQMRSVYGLGVLRDSIYWLNYNYAFDVIYKGPKNKNGILVTKMIYPINNTVWDMKLVHPDLQKQPIKNPCPDGLVLNKNKKACVEFRLTKEALVRSVDSRLSVVLLSVFLVTVCILLFVSLAYLVDKYWASLRDRLPGRGLPYRREKGTEEAVTSQYHVDNTGDNVRLV